MTSINFNVISLIRAGFEPKALNPRISKNMRQTLNSFGHPIWSIIEENTYRRFQEVCHSTWRRRSCQRGRQGTPVRRVDSLLAPSQCLNTSPCSTHSFVRKYNTTVSTRRRHQVRHEHQQTCICEIFCCCCW